MHKYGSKYELYRDFDLAIKLIVEDIARPDYYVRIIDALRFDQRCKLERIQEAIRGLRPDDPPGIGFFVELPARGDAGDVLGTQFVLIEHETGPELFVPIVTDPHVLSGLLFVLIFVRNRVFDELYKKLREETMARIGPLVRHFWQEARGGARISAVEIRTENRGVCRVRFSAFDVEQITCLLRKINENPSGQLIQFNQHCFNGELVEVRQPSGDEAEA